MLDASARRLQAQKIYLRAVAVVRWANSRNAILQGQMPHSGNAVMLQQADGNLRAVSFGLFTPESEEGLTRRAGALDDYGSTLCQRAEDEGRPSWTLAARRSAAANDTRLDSITALSAWTSVPGC